MNMREEFDNWVKTIDTRNVTEDQIWQAAWKARQEYDAKICDGLIVKAPDTTGLAGGWMLKGAIEQGNDKYIECADAIRKQD